MYYGSGKPFTRWWWYSCNIRREDISSQLEWLADKGFGGVEIAWIFPPRDPWRKVLPNITPGEEIQRRRAAPWLSAEWTDDAVFAKAEAARLGLGCDFTFGTLWPFGDSHVTQADASRQYTLNEDGGVEFDFQKIRQTWEHPVEGYVIDHLNRGAFDRYAERIGDALAPALAGAPSGLFCESWEVHSDTLWTEGFEERFHDRYSYDVRPFLPSIWAPSSDPDIRYDYLALLSDMILDNFYRPFAERAKGLGAFSRAQVAGAPVDMLEAYSIVDVPETEAMLFEPRYARIVSSAAALGKRNDVSSESFTCIYGFPGWVPNIYLGQEKVGDLKIVADALFAHGVNQIFWHGTPFTPSDAEHDFPFYAPVHVGKHDGSLSSHVKSFNGYLEKVSNWMKAGRPYSDVAMWLPLADGRMDTDYPAHLRIPGSSRPYELRYVYPADEVTGYHPLYVSNASLKEAVVSNGVIQAGDAEFRAIYVDVQYLEIECLQTLLRFAEAGIPIVVKQLPKQPGRAKSPNYVNMVQRLFALGARSQFHQSVRWPALVKASDGSRTPDFWARWIGENDLIIFFSHPDSYDLRIPLSYDQSAASKDVTRRVIISLPGTERREMRLDFSANQSLLVRVNQSGVEFVDIAYHPPH